MALLGPAGFVGFSWRSVSRVCGASGCQGGHPRLPGSRPEQPFYRFTVIFGSRFHPPMWKPWFRFRGFSEPKLWFGVGPSFNSKPHPRSPQKSNAGAGVPGLDLLRHVCGVGGPCRPHFFLKCSCPPCYGRNSTMVEPEVLESSYPE